MDLHVFSGVMTGVLMVAYVGIGLWAWSRHRRHDFEQAARLPFADDEPPRTDQGER